MSEQAIAAEDLHMQVNTRMFSYIDRGWLVE